MKNTYSDLNARLHKYREVRGWNDLPAQDLAKSIMIESAELLEHFQWDEHWRGGEDVPEKNWDKIGSEVADIFIYLMEFCQDNDLNLIDITNKKLDKVEKKYPVDFSKDSSEYLRIKNEHRLNKS